MEYFGMSQLVRELSGRLRDGGHSKWSLLEKHQALRDAARQLEGRYGVEMLYTSLSLATGVYDYVLPAFVEDILRIERQNVSTTGDSLTVIPWNELLWWEVRPTGMTNFLYIDEDVAPTDTRVWYKHKVPSLPPAQMTLAAAINPTQGSIPVGAGASSLSIWDYNQTGFAMLSEGGKREVIFYEALTNTSFVKVTRGIFGVAASFNSSVTVDPVVVMEGRGAAYEWLLAESRAICYETLLGDGSVMDRSSEQFLTRWNRQRADELARALHETRRPGRIKIGSRGRLMP